MNTGPAVVDALKRLARSRTDGDAWSVLFKEMWPFIFAVVYRRMRGDRSAAEDATQEVFIRLLNSCPFPDLQTSDAFRAYAWRVADNVARSKWRRREKAREIQWIPGTSEEIGDRSATEFASEVELSEILKDVWRGLDSSDRQLLRLLIRGAGVKEIARRLRISYTNAGVRVFRLRRRLRKSLIFNGLTAEM